MTIGLEARWITLPTTGFGNYANNLVNLMPHIDSARRYVVYSNQSVPEATLPLCKNLEIRVLSRRSAIYKHLALPNSVRRTRDIDLFHFLYNAPPFVFPVPYILTIHDISYVHVPNMINIRDRLSITLQLPLTATRARHIIAVSQNTKDDVTKFLGIDPGNITVVYEGVGKQFSTITDPLVIRRVVDKYHLPERYLLYVGTYLPHKNLATLLRAFGMVRARKSCGYMLVLAGSKGRNYAAIQRLVAELRLTESVKCIGFVDDEDLPVVYALSDLFVFPSLYEGFGLPLLEAMACETPVLTSNSSSLSEVGGDAVEYFDPMSQEELAYKILFLLDNPSRRDELVAAGKRRVAKFTWQRAAEETIGVYDRVLSM